MQSINPINFYGSKIYRYNLYKGKSLVYSTVLTRPPADVMPELRGKVFSYDRYDKIKVYCNEQYVGFISCNG